MRDRSQNPGSISALIIVPVLIHLLISIVVYVIAITGAYRAGFDSHGIGEFAPDTRLYLVQCQSLANELHARDFGAFLASPDPLHVKLYSLSYFLLGPVFGFTNLAIEPLNLLWFTLIVVLVYQIGLLLFDRPAGLMAAAIVMLWPTFLIHTTQPLKDPLYIVSLLALVLIIACSIKRSLSVLELVRNGCLALLLLLLASATRPNLRQLALFITLVGASLVLIRRIMNTKALRTRIILIVLMAALGAGAIIFLATKRSPVPQMAGHCSGILADICVNREGAIVSTVGLRSNVDANVRFVSSPDVLKYIPRALEIGLFSPFPTMWFESGSFVGRAGRLVAAGETICLYLLYPFAIFGVWIQRKQPSVWFVVAAFLAAILSIGLVMVNIGTIYRIRYGFVMLAIILAAGGVSAVLQRGRPGPVVREV
jgi:hypothetical protein